VPSTVSAHSYNDNPSDYSHARHWREVCNDGADQNSGTVVDALVQDGRFTTLVAAVKAAGLVDALNSTDQKTVFAPTDSAFRWTDYKFVGT